MISFVRSLRYLQTDTLRSSMVGIVTVAALLCAWIIWFCAAEVSLYAVTPHARLEVSQASFRMDAPISGRIVAVYARLDQPVKRGELLFELDAQSLRLQQVEYQGRLQSLRAQLAMGQRESRNAELIIKELRTGSQLSVAEAEAQRRQVEPQAGFTKERTKRLAELRKLGGTYELEYLRSQAESTKLQATVEQRSLALQRQKADAQRLVHEQAARHDLLLREMVKLQGEITTIEARLGQLAHQIELHAIRAPADGRVGELVVVRPGTYLQEGARLATIVPTGTLTIVAEFEPAEALGRIQPTQPAELRLDGFSWAEYGSLHATVTAVATEPRQGQIRAELRLRPNTSHTIPLQHGLTGSVEILTEKITPLRLLLRTVGHWIRQGPRPPKNA